MRGCQKLIRRGFRAALVGAAVWLAAPTHGEAQSCATQNGIYACTITGNYSSGIAANAPVEIVYWEGFAVAANALPMTVTSEGTMNITVSSSQRTALVFSAFGGNQDANGSPQGMVITNNGSLTLGQSQPTVIDNYLFGLWAQEAIATGPGATYMSGQPLPQQLTINNSGAITIDLPNVQVWSGAAIWAEAQGGVGVSGPAGASGGVAITNTGAITATLNGQYGFSGISAGGYGGDTAGIVDGGGSSVSSVSNAAPVSVGLNWQNTDTTNYGLFGIQVVSGGGNGGDNAAGNGGHGGFANAALVELALGGDVSVAQTGTPPPGLGPFPALDVNGAGVLAAVQGGNGGSGTGVDYASGGAGGDAGGAQIDVTDANVTTTGDYLPGLAILAQGGNGGNGGCGPPQGFDCDESDNTYSYANGGSGGSVTGYDYPDGHTNSVTVTAATLPVTISTTGGTSPAIFALLQGGTGGWAGINYGLGADSTGNGGAGGDITGDLNISLSGTTQNPINLTTTGSTSPGINATSLGGIGGDGGQLISTGGTHHAGYGGDGGSGGDITIGLTAASISTQETSSPGIVAQSEGAAGASGGAATGEFVTGGNGGSGGGAGNVTITLDSASGITTQGTDSTGIVAQSLSAAGGAGGTADGTGSGTAGSGGAGGNAGSVTVTNDGAISTAGATARGIIAQSIPGAGGSGGLGEGFFYSGGGTGASSGAAGSVTVTNGGSITTTGSNAHGILAQSIGGSGGAGGQATGTFDAVGGDATTNPLNAAGSGVSINFSSGSVITTSGISAIGVLGQSIGGGGGDGGGATGAATVGGSGGAGGGGGSVAFSSGADSQVTTTGDFSPAVVMQSIGGGGGNAGNASSAGLFTSVSVGGSGGSGGAGAEVALNTSQTTISTAGSQSPGLLAQSIGGGGGTGGAAFAESIGAGFSASVAVGGTGGSGGDGGYVWGAVSQQTIATGQNPLLLTGETTDQGPCPSLPCNLLPTDSYGVLIQSIGGGGGSGGSAIAQSVAIAIPVDTDGDQLAVALSTAGAGKGGGGGNGGTAEFTLSNGGTIITSGQGSTAAIVQSIGGGGGAGGDSSAMAATVGYGLPLPEDPGSLGVAATFTIGGAGANGGSGDAVNAAIGGTITSGVFSVDPPGSDPTSITTFGDFAGGLIAQSIGGGGGNAGYGSGNTQSFGTGTTTSVSVTLGSTGGSGGAGGGVQAYLYPGNGITTYGSGAVGMMAQSIGGGGGTSQGGSFNVAQTFQSDDGKTTIKPGLNLGLGTTGGSGGDGGNVSVSQQAQITTRGGDATGILAQSIGGGGGTGGSAGADASADNPVVAALAVREGVSNVFSYYQSEFQVKDVPVDATFSVSLGGAGGSSGNGGSVAVDLSAPITTTGDWANGVVAQSIGGGGGKGGSAAASGTGGLPEVTINLDFAVGGQGSNGGSGDSVLVNLNEGTTDISTAGFGAAAIIAQSVGGGGGIGADGSDSATGLLSVGGSTEGGGGQGGNAGSVAVKYWNPNGTTISTVGEAADGVILQSIGGGGGIAGAGSSLFVGAFKQSGTLTLSAGGKLNAGGTGGAVTFEPQEGYDTPIAISTTGNNSFGILAQSIGGGGGLVTSQPTSNSETYQIGVGGSLSDGPGGSVNVTLLSQSTVTTTGVGAHGIVAQSIGGGGGIVRMVNQSGDSPTLDTSMPSSLSGGSGLGDGGTVDVEVDGSVSVFGAGAVGILAQSVGGSGGLVMNGNTFYAGSPNLASSNGAGDTVTVTVGGTVSAAGANAIGIFGQSTGASSSGQVNITVNSSVTGGSGQAATSDSSGNATQVGSSAIQVDSPSGSNSGNGNIVTVSAGGSLSTMSGTSGTAIVQTGGGTTNVTSSGTITGSTYLGGGSVSDDTPQASASAGGTFDNYGTYHAGAIVDAALLTNSSTVNVGMPGEVRSTNVTGDFIQTGSGRLGVTIDSLNTAASHVQVDGYSSVDGLIVPTAITLLPGSVPVVTAGDLDSTADGLDSLVFYWDAAQSENTLSITPRSNFTPDGVSLTDSQASMANHFEQAWQNADTGFATHFGNLSQIADAGGYAVALDEYSSKDIYAQSIALANSAGAILGSSMSCPVFVGQDVRLGEDSCTWLSVAGRWSNQDGTGDIQGYDVSGVTYRIGAQQAIAPDWYLGGSFAYTHTSATMEGGSSGDGETFDGSISLKHTMGPWFFAGSVALAHGSFDVNRQVNLPGYIAPLESDPSIFLAGARLRAGYEFAFDDWYVRPYGDLDVIYTHMPEVSESGSSPYALDLGSSSETNVRLSLMTEFGGRIDLDAGTTLRPYAAIGVSYLPDNTRTIDGRFASATADNGTFTDRLEAPELLGRIDLGLQLYSGSGFEVKAGYTADIGGSFLSQTASARVGFHF